MPWRWATASPRCCCTTWPLAPSLPTSLPRVGRMSHLVGRTEAGSTCMARGTAWQGRSVAQLTRLARLLAHAPLIPPVSPAQTSPTSGLVPAHTRPDVLARLPHLACRDKPDHRPSSEDAGQPVHHRGQLRRRQGELACLLLVQTGRRPCTRVIFCAWHGLQAGPGWQRRTGLQVEALCVVTWPQ